MALNLSTLTSSATSGDVLAEALTTADFLEGVPVLRNLARGSQKGGDAKQDVALNQPKALPLDANGKGYLYQPSVLGNAPAVTFPTIGASDDFVLEMVAYIVNVDDFHVVSGSSLHRILIYNTGGSPSFQYRDGSNNNNAALSGSLSAGLSTLRFEKTGSTLVFKQNGAVKGTINNITAAPTFTHLSFNGQFSTSRLPLNGYIQTATLSIGGTEQLNIDFTATNVRHGDTKFKCATGQVVTVNQSGNDPGTIIKKPVLRFDGTNDGLRGLFANNINGGYMFAAFSVLGDGGESNGRVFSVDATGYFDYEANGAVFGYNASGNLTAFNVKSHTGMFDDANGDILQETKITNGSALSKVNNADAGTSSGFVINSSNFNVVTNTLGQNAAIDLEYLALFPATITDDQADDVRNYINNRNNVFDLKDGFGYYFYDAQKAPVGAISSGANAWSGRIVGSDNGDSASIEATQATANHQPVSDGFKVTFADNTDHLDIPSTSQAGWQIVGTSLGCFVYRVNANAQVRLNLLGYRGSASFRKAGDLYGIILLPESATGADIEAARKLLIDRGAADGTTTNNLYTAWYQRDDIVEFKHTDTSGVTSANDAWGLSDNLAIFPSLNLSSCASFQRTWKSCSALTSFPAGAKLGTSASSVNFTEAWRESGLTSFNTDLPTGTIFQKTWRQSALTSFGSIDLSSGNSFNSSWQLATSLSSFGAIDARNGTNFQEAWRDCSSLTDFSGDAKLGTSASNVNFQSAWQSSGLTSFSTPLPTATTLVNAFRGCNSLTSFDLDEIPLVTNCQLTWPSNPALTSFSTKLPKCEFLNAAWYNCSALTDFSADVFTDWDPQSISSGVFNNAWDGCTALTAQSVENILTSIDASGKYGTATGAAGGGSIDSGIDIDYDGTTLSAATNSAVTSLKSKGWSIIVNNVTL